ncbi:MAG: GHKL domain-containing protein [Clostridiaceae bacterium]|nr:GHKL domain-containing protein [Clostridiaceae bacterium]
MGIFIFNVSFAVSTKENIFLYEILLSSIFLLFIFLGALVYQEKKQLLKIEHVYKSQQEYIQNMETIMNIIRREKHDFSNHLSTIHAMCVLNKPNTPEKIKAYIDKLANSLHSSYRYFNTGNDFIDGLLAVKSNFAFNHNIHFEVDFEIPLNHLSVEDENLISILSNIIDNAFDAIATDEDTENKVVSICTYAEDHRHYLSVSNNGPMISKENIDKIFSNGYSSKTNNKGDHGLGLYIVKQLIEKNNGTITVSSNEEETNFLIRFNKEKINHGKTSPQHH